MADNQIRTYTYTQNFVKYFNICLHGEFVYRLCFLFIQLLVPAALVVDIVVCVDLVCLLKGIYIV